jgi:hypothetical protein
MAVDFWTAPEHIKGMAQELIAEFHPEIATANISYMMKSEASGPEIESGQVCVAKKVGGIYKELTNGVDFVIVIAQSLYMELTTIQQRAMLDSALTTCTAKVIDGDFKLDANGNPCWLLKPFDVVAHSDIIVRYGIEVLREAGDRIQASLDSKVEEEVKAKKSKKTDA